MTTPCSATSLSTFFVKYTHIQGKPRPFLTSCSIPYPSLFSHALSSQLVWINRVTHHFIRTYTSLQRHVNTRSCHSEISVSGRFHGHISPWSGIWTFFDRSHGKGGSCLGDCARDDLQPLPTSFLFLWL